MAVCVIARNYQSRAPRAKGSYQVSESSDRFISFYHEGTRHTLLIEEIDAKLFGTDRLLVSVTPDKVN